jgi:RNA polymerase sigma-70 factor (ECF subfamily)
MSLIDAIATQVDEGSQDGVLVGRAMRGDHEAFDRLIRPRLDRQIRFAMSLLRDESDARDVLQETCLRAWRELPRLRDPSRFDSWMNQILVNVARTHLKRRQRVHVREMPPQEIERTDGRQETTDGGSADFSESDMIRRAFARLDADKRTLLILRHVEGRSVLEIARLLRVPEGTAKWRLHAARSDLERALEVEDR